MSAYSDRVIADGATNYWRLNEASGTTAVDSAGSRNATISGGVTLGVPGVRSADTAMGLDGSGGIRPSTFPPLPPAFSLEAWVYPTSSPPRLAIICRDIFTDGDFVWELRPQVSLLHFQCYAGGFLNDNRAAALLHGQSQGKICAHKRLSVLLLRT